MFGGSGPFPCGGQWGRFNDYWVYNLTLNQWKWINGLNGINGVGSFGAVGIENITNYPRNRDRLAMAWHPASGGYFLFGGLTNWLQIGLSDLWFNNRHNDYWTWMDGTDVGNTVTSFPPDYRVTGSGYKLGNRWGASMVVEPKSGSVVVFGGTGLFK